MRAERIHNYETARTLARRRLPRVLFDYVDGGADDEITLRENHAAFGRIVFRPRQAVSVPAADYRTTVLGTELSMPIALAPCGGSRLLCPDGERKLVRAAAAAGTVATLSTASSTPLEDVAAAAGGRVWFQLYYPGRRDLATHLVERAARAGFRALFVTVDLPIRGNQERVRSAERVVPPDPTLSNAVRFSGQLLSRPGWTLRYVLDGRTRGVTHEPGRPATDFLPQATRSTRANVTWADVEWLRSIWSGPFVVKGVLTGEDARRALDCGADAVVVSNHGGRQLDGTAATIVALPEVRAAVGADAEVLLDGGIRRGADALKAIALGADAVLIGRPYLYGLAVAGEAGVRRVLAYLEDDLARTMKLLGRPSLAEIGGDALA